MSAERLGDIARFYELLSELEERLGGKRTLGDLSGITFPDRGVYFFFEPSENRSDSGHGSRVVRVGTHAVSAGSKTKLRSRLAQHRGAVKSGGGNHRGSIFRLIVGEALAARHPELICPHWSKGSSAPASICSGEQILEAAVSAYLRSMPFVWIEADDPSGKESIRNTVERNSIAMLSNYGRHEEDVVDPLSTSWLGGRSGRAKVRGSGLWNSNYVDDGTYDPGFLGQLEGLVRRTI